MVYNNIMRKKRLIMERMVPIAKSNDDFDIRFWQKAGVFARFSAAWKMLEEFYRIRGVRGHKFRLQRSVENFQPR